MLGRKREKTKEKEAVAEVNQSQEQPDAAQTLQPVAVSELATAHNAFIKRALIKREGLTGVELLRQLVDASGSSSDKALLTEILPALAAAGQLPTPLLQKLQQAQLKCKDSKALRVMYYLTQTILSPGSAGTPLQFNRDTGSNVAPCPALTWPASAIAPSWAVLQSGSNDTAQTRCAARCLAAAARCHNMLGGQRAGNAADGDIVAELARTVLSTLEASDKPEKGGKSKRGPKLFSAGKTQKKADIAEDSVVHSMLAAARVGMHEGTLQNIERAAVVYVTSDDPVAARHALALAASAMEHSPQPVIETLLPHIQSSSHMLAAPTSTQKSPEKSRKADAAAAPPLNLRDPFSRRYLAHICAQGLLTVGQGTTDGPNQRVLWQTLVSLALNDASYLVAVDTIQCMFGRPLMKAANLTAIDVSFDVKSIAGQRQAGDRMAMAWDMCMRESGTLLSVGGAAVDGTAISSTQLPLFVQIVSMLKGLLMDETSSSAEQLAACRTMQVMAESRSHAFRKRPSLPQLQPPEVRDLMDQLATMLSMLLTVPHNSPKAPSTSIRAAALEALIWMQLPGDCSITPRMLYEEVQQGASVTPKPGKGTAANTSWSRARLYGVYKSFARKVIASPDMSYWALCCTHAVAAGHPYAAGSRTLRALWDMVASNGPKARICALRAVMELLAAPWPACCMVHGDGVASGQKLQLTNAAVQAGAWMQVRITAVWWLGENANAVVSEDDDYPQGNVQVRRTILFGETPEPAAEEKKAAEVAVSQHNPAEYLPKKFGEKPVLQCVIEQLHQCMLTESWPMRCQAARALGKLAIRCGEPYRIHCFEILATSLLNTRASSHALEQDALGLASHIKPILRILDDMYSGQVIVRKLVHKYTDKLKDWPKELLKDVQNRHLSLLQRIHFQVGTMPADFLPLGLPSQPIVAAVGGFTAPTLATTAGVAAGFSTAAATSMAAVAVQRQNDIAAGGGGDDFGFAAVKQISRNDGRGGADAFGTMADVSYRRDDADFTSGSRKDQTNVFAPHIEDDYSTAAAPESRADGSQPPPARQAAADDELGFAVVKHGLTRSTTMFPALSPDDEQADYSTTAYKQQADASGTPSDAYTATSAAADEGVGGRGYESSDDEDGRGNFYTAPPPYAAAAKPAAEPRSRNFWDDDEDDMLPQPSQPPKPAAAAASPSTSNGVRGRVAYEFVAEGDGELSVKAGESVTVLYGTSDGWWVVQTAAGARGLVPQWTVPLPPGVNVPIRDDAA